MDLGLFLFGLLALRQFVVAPILQKLWSYFLFIPVRLHLRLDDAEAEGRVVRHRGGGSRQRHDAAADDAGREINALTHARASRSFPGTKISVSLFCVCFHDDEKKLCSSSFERMSKCEIKIKLGRQAAALPSPPLDRWQHLNRFMSSSQETIMTPPSSSRSLVLTRIFYFAFQANSFPRSKFLDLNRSS